MLRRLGIGFIALAAMSPGLAAALGVGEYELNSYLNQPLDMTVQLQDLGDLSKDQILVELGSQEQFDNAGVERAYFLNSLDFEVTLDASGDTGQLRITSDQPVREPYLDFLVQFLWPTGRLMREYTVLLDPPSYADADSAVTPARSEAPPRPVSRPAPSQPERPRPAPARAPAPVGTEAPVADTASTDTAEQRTYRVGASDTMWRIAERTRPNAGVSVQQMMLAIQERNPDAFINNNVNLVREGAVLRLPSESQVRDLSSREALSRVAAQNREWQRLRDQRAPAPSRAPVDATGRQQADRDGAGADGDGRVTLVTPDSAEGVGDGDGTGSAGGGQANTAALQNELAIRDENLDRLQRENDELRSRIGDLDGQVEVSQRLLELRNEKIAALQEELRRLSEQQGTEVDPQLLEEPATPMPVEPDDGIGDGAVGPNGETAEGADPDQGTAPRDASGGESGDVAGGKAPATDQAAPPGGQSGDTRDNKAANPPPKPKPATPASDAGGGIVDLIMGNLIYIGAALAVLLLLILLAVRRRQGGDNGGDDEAGFGDDDGGFDAAPVMGTEGDDEDSRDAGVPQEDLDDEHMDPMERADVYVAYGQYPQAVDYLRNEINQAPERGDLKIRLLELLREMNDDNGFHQQAAMFAGTSVAVDAAIKRLGGEPGDADEYAAIADDPEEDGPQEEEELSLDDLELDLASDLSDGGFDDGAMVSSDQSEGDDQGGLELDDFDFKLDDDDQPATAGLEAGDTDSADGDEQTLEFDELVLDEPDAAGEPMAAEGDDDGAFEFSLDDDGEEGTTFTEDELAALDQADQRAREGSDATASDLGDLELDDLELDDLDVELNDGPAQDSPAADAEIADSVEEPRADVDDLDLSLDDLDLSDDDAPEDRVGDAPLSEAAEADEPDTLASASRELDDLELEFGDDEAEPAPAVAGAAGPDKGDDMLGDDDDFDFLGETDENATKLDLARAYIDMGDAEGARDILNEVLSEGSEEQQGEAKELLARVS
ncbi:FimV/HubP family polar landmark protein [Alloalcanivorax sp. C16-2]|uniref:FimV/HubP family polar landmark protein n=1 Tax=Alloalcanivorax sp. C16-2 TaxID=3390052 RepID=UPI003970B354